MAAQLELSQRPFIELQIEALLNENRLKPKRVNKFICQLETRLVNVKESLCEKLSKKTLKLPIIGRPNSAGSDYPKCFKFEPPKQIDVIGGFKTSTAIKRRNYVDLAACMPTQCFEKKDIKNQRYHHKRALYLAQLALLLNTKIGKGLIHKVQFKYHQGDFLKPVLIIEPQDEKLRKNTSFQLFCFLEPETAIKSSLLNPTHGNVSPRWFFKDYPLETQDDELEKFFQGDSDVVTSPFYNSGILFDLEMISNSDILDHHIGLYTSVTEALMLIKIWLYQRDLHHHFSFILSMYIACLQTQRIIHHNMSSYQIFKQVIKSLAQSDWSTTGMSFYEDSKTKISTFKAAFPVVFLSPSCNLNLCYNITKDLYNRLKHEAKLSNDLLEANSSEAFELLFLVKIRFINKFDVMVHLPKSVKKIPLKRNFLPRLIDYGVLTNRIYSASLLDLIERSLTDRVKLVQQDIENSLLERQWDFNRKPYDPTDEDAATTYGLLLNAEESLRTVDIGPPAQTPEAEEFRQFWEPKCQLRLQNGVISETVVWPVDNFSQRRDIIRQILSHILKRADFNEVCVHYTFLERFIGLRNVFFHWRDTIGLKESNGNSNKRKREDVAAIGVGEETFQKVLHSYNELNKILRNIDNMQHSITAIQPTSHHLRGSAIFPPLPVSLQSKNDYLKRQKGAALFPDDFSQTSKILHLEPVEILLTLENTGKWPKEMEAFEAAKLEYLVELGEELREREYSVKFAENYLDVMHGQFVFRLRVKCSKELHLVAASGGKHEFQQRRLQLDILPRLHAALDQLYREKPAFGLTCRLIKRWMCCHLMTDHIDEIVLDLMVARVFLHPEPYTEPASSACGFRRVLMLIAQFDWKTNPLVVNFDQQLKADEIGQLREQMADDRSKFPPIVIRTPFDKDTSPWTRKEPSLVKLDLIRRMCAKALMMLDDDGPADCEPLFRPNLKLFKLLIKLQSAVVQNFFMSLDPPRGFRLFGQEPPYKQPSPFKVMPVVGMNLVEQFVLLLRERFDHVALFFYDKYGQQVIGVVLKPDAEQSLNDGLDRFADEIRQLGSKMVDSVTVF